ncbi:nuclear control of ATPase protein 2, partial [Lecanoromycetidae sp. Uapishka_2]
MSFVLDHISHVDAQLDRLQLSKRLSNPASPDLHSTEESDVSIQGFAMAGSLKLQAAIKTLSTAATSKGLLSSDTILAALRQGQELRDNGEEDTLHLTQDELHWLLITKAATQTYGLILNVLLEQTIPLNSDIGYWDEVLGSYRYTGLYAVQTSPIRLWNWANEVYNDARQRLQLTRNAGDNQEESERSLSISDRWGQFYGLVKDSVRDRSLVDMQSRFMSPLMKSRMEARSKRNRLKRLREMSASGLGILMDEGMIFDTDEEESTSSKSRSNSKEEWQSVVSKSVSLMETVLRNITVLELGASELEETVFMSVDDDAETSDTAAPQAARLGDRLQHILRVHLPAHITASRDLTAEYGRPSRLVRYWLPGLALFFSSSTLLRVLVNRKAEITIWIRDLGSTSVDFWYNWVVEPVKKIIGTVRHDKDSEIAIMSKESLQGDKASLERMVVDFVKDNPANGNSLTEAQVADVRAKVREGDLTPVLTAYEKDLRNPFRRAVTGDLIRALLIQVQKTKVDVEVAVGGIDNLLKSQELVFGFVGLTPGVLVCLGVSRWLKGAFSGRRARAQGGKQGSMVRTLRNIDRILVSCTPMENGMLSYKDHGMLLCEVHVLRKKGQRILPGEMFNDFLEEVNELIDLRTGVDRQIRVVQRIRWAYSKWLQ